MRKDAWFGCWLSGLAPERHARAHDILFEKFNENNLQLGTTTRATATATTTTTTNCRLKAMLFLISDPTSVDRRVSTVCVQGSVFVCVLFELL